jgi:ribosome biogenesis ATPase
VSKLAEEQSQLSNGGKKLTVAIVYESIKSSNSSLKRRSKKQLEDSAERVLSVMEQERDDSDSVDGDFEGLEDPIPVLKVSRVDGMRVSVAHGNRNIIS